MKVSFLVLFAILVSPLGFAQSGRDQRPDQGTIAQVSQPSTAKVKMRLAEAVSSANAKVGQVVRLEVVDSVEIEGKLVIAAGTEVHGTVTQARRRGHNGREGQVQFTVSTIKEGDGSELHVGFATVQKGSGHGEPIFGPCTFPIPADPVGLFRKGQDVVIPKGTELSAEIVG